MKKSIVIFLAFFLILSNSKAQDEVKWGPLYKKGGRFSACIVVGADKDHYYVNLNPFQSKSTLLTFDYEHKLVSSKPIELEYEKTNLIPLSFIKTSTKTFAYIHDYDQKKKKVRVFVAEFKDGKFGAIRKVHEQKYQYGLLSYKVGLLTNYADTDNEPTAISENKKYIAYSNSHSFLSRKNPDMIGIVVFDDNMDVVWEKQQKFPYEDDKMKVMQVEVSNVGEVFFTAKIYKEKGEKEKGELSYDYKIFKISEQDIQEIDIDLGSNKNVAKGVLFFDEDDKEVKFAGLYTDVVVRSKINGVFFSIIDLSNNKVVSKTEKFTDDFLAGLVSNKDIEKGKGLSNSYKIFDFITWNDGTFSFLAEKNYRIESTKYVDGKPSTSYTYVSDEIIIPRFSSEGELINIEKIDKKYRSGSPRACSYSSTAINGEIYILFNDTKKREEKKDIKSQGLEKGVRTLYTDLCIISADGSLKSRKTIFTDKDIDAIYMPWLSFERGNKLFIAALSRSKYRFGILKTD